VNVLLSNGSVHLRPRTPCPTLHSVNASELDKLLNFAELSQSEAARQLDIDPRTMRRYLAGDLAIPRAVEIAIKAVTETWSPTLQLREVNKRLRDVAQLAEKELERIAAGDEDCRRIARSALKRIVDIKARLS
jgi:hypothetical protein